jgi:hypothetical protein
MSLAAPKRARLGSITPRGPRLRDTCQRWCAAGALLLLVAPGCARTGLDPGDLETGFDSESGGAPSTPAPMTTGASGAAAVAGAPSTAGAPSMAGAPSAAGTPGTQVPAPEPSTPAPGPSAPVATGPTCVPVPETCNGADDDCDGEVDNVPPEACPGGGFRYCVAGKLSSCPKSCQVCVPGSVRICQNSYCTFWGEQECTADGQGFGPCREGTPPPACAAIAAKQQDSPELEQCCIDDGYCCIDSHDLDGDGDRHEMIGACEGVRCR